VVSVRILHIAWGFRPWRVGGLIAYAEDLAVAQIAQGHDVHLLCAGRHYPGLAHARRRDWHRAGVTVHELLNTPVIPGLEAGTQSPLRELDEPLTEAACRTALDAIRPDVIHVHELLGLPSAVLDRAAEARVPVIMSLHDYGLLCPTLKLYDVDDQLCMRQEVGDQCARCCAMAPRTDRHLVRMTLVYEALRAAAALGPLEAHLRAAWRKALAVRGRRRLAVEGPAAVPATLVADAPPAAYQRRRDVNVARLNRVDRLLAISTRVAEVYASLGVERARLDVLPVTHAGLAAISPSPDRPVGRPLVFSTANGFMSRQKGADVLTGALEELRARGYGGRFRLDAWGFVAPVVRSALEDDPDVELHGPYGPSDVAQMHRRADVGLMPSVWEEALGFVAVEYLAAGVPVIANARGGVTDYVRDGETGWLNRDASASGLARLMARCIDEPSEVAAMRKRVRERRSEFGRTMSEHARQVETVYEQVALTADRPVS
jgi:glycosyltransferase involved in cell wall biosynthesis